MADKRLGLSTDMLQESSYRSIFKATSLFGGVQVYQILLSIIKSKVIAVLLGPLGVGIIGMYTSAEQLLKSITYMGLQSSAVRDISEANGSLNEDLLAQRIAILKRLIVFTGFLALFVMMVLSPILSKTSFGDYKYTVPFLFFSACMLFDQLCNGQKIILQGMRKLRSLAIVTAIASTVGLIVSIPAFYVWGINGIIPSLILTSLISLLLTWMITRKIHIKQVHVTIKYAVKGGSSMLKLGVAMSLSGILGTFSTYLVRAFVRYYGGVDEVGFFTAGFMLMTTYTGLVFTAMSTDYFPRLAAVNKDNVKCRNIVNQQGEIGVLILTPLLVICMVFIPYIVKILYSDAFMTTNGYIVWACMGMLFKMAAWAISYVFVAKAEAKMFAYIETISNIISIILSICGYYVAGITGLGIAFSVGFVFYLLIVYYMAHKKFEFCFTHSFRTLLVVEVIFVGICLILVLIAPVYIKYIVGSLIILLSILYSLKELNNRMNFVDVLMSYTHGRK